MSLTEAKFGHFTLTPSSIVSPRADGRGHTSISEAAAQGHEDVIRLLLTEGANPNALNDSNRSAIWRACYNGHVGALTLLLEAGADPLFRDKVSFTHKAFVTFGGCLYYFFLRGSSVLIVSHSCTVSGTTV